MCANRRHNGPSRTVHFMNLKQAVQNPGFTSPRAEFPIEDVRNRLVSKALFTLQLLTYNISQNILDSWLDHNKNFGDNAKLFSFHPLPPSSNVVEVM